FVTVSTGGWHTHRDTWNRPKTAPLPPFDQGLAASLSGLEQRGLLDSAVVHVSGELGRTPESDTERGGRAHHPTRMALPRGGGGVRGGQVIGASNDKGTAPEGGGYAPDDVAASFYHTLGIDHTKEYHTTAGRPVMIVRDGHVIEQLFS